VTLKLRVREPVLRNSTDPELFAGDCEGGPPAEYYFRLVNFLMICSTFALRQAETGTPVEEVRCMGIADQTQ
jgi:hypothetical protein